MLAQFLSFPKQIAQAKVNCLDGTVCDPGLPTVGADNANLQVILQIVFGAIAAAAMVFIIIAALRLIASQGDPKALARHRDTLIYAVVGLAVALSAEAIVTFVLGNI